MQSNHRGMLWPVLAGLLCLALFWAAAAARPRAQNTPAPFAAYAGSSWQAMEQTCLSDPTDENLLELLRSLAWHSEQGDAQAQDKLAQYGGALLDRAKAGDVDLQIIDPDEQRMLALLETIRKYL